jgi:ERCC4-type nuclease
MTTIKAYIDTRERELLPLLAAWPSKTLPVGDIWIGLSGEEIATGGIVIERKTVADFEASIIDGRYREQRTRLVSYCQQHGGRPLYIIEGDMDRMLGKFSEQTLQKMLNRLMLRYGVPVIHTVSVEGTANACRLLATQIEEESTIFVATDAGALSYASTVTVSKRGNRDDPRNFALGVLQGCPGISCAAATAILDTFGTLSGVFAAEEAALATVLVGKRKVGPVVAKRLLGLLRS